MIILKFIDTHCHLDDSGFNSDLDSIIESSNLNQIGIISSSITRSTWQKGAEIASKYENVFLSLGLDPSNFNDVSYAVDMIRNCKEDIVAIGEIGLDHYIVRDHGERELQEIAFMKLLGVASELKLPVQIHSRSAGKATLDILYRSHDGEVQMHAFDGKSGYARIASQDYGYYFSIPTSVVRSPQKQKLVKAVEIERLLVETDSPVLAAEKSTRNEPANLPIAVAEISKILRRNEEEVREIILENTLRLYKKINPVR